VNNNIGPLAEIQQRLAPRSMNNSKVWGLVVVNVVIDDSLLTRIWNPKLQCYHATIKSAIFAEYTLILYAKVFCIV
jgi:hypothetical protein